MSLQRINNRGDSRATSASSKLFSTAIVASQRGSRSFITSHLNLHMLINTRHEQHSTRWELSAHDGGKLSLASVPHRDPCDTRRVLLEATVSGEPKVSKKTSPG